MSGCTVAYNYTGRDVGGDSSGLFDDSVSVTAHTYRQTTTTAAEISQKFRQYWNRITHEQMFEALPIKQYIQRLA